MQFLQCYFTFWILVGPWIRKCYCWCFFFFSLYYFMILLVNISSYFLIGYFVNCPCLLACSGKPAAMMYLCASQFYLRHVVWTQTAVVTTTFSEENESSQTSERILVVMKVFKDFFGILLDFFFFCKIEDNYVKLVEYSAKQLTVFILLIMCWMR